MPMMNLPSQLDDVLISHDTKTIAYQHDLADSASIVSSWCIITGATINGPLDQFLYQGGNSGPALPVVRLYDWNPIVIRSGYGIMVYQAGVITLPYACVVRWQEK